MQVLGSVGAGLSEANDVFWQGLSLYAEYADRADLCGFFIQTVSILSGGLALFQPVVEGCDSTYSPYPSTTREEHLLRSGFLTFVC